MSAASRSPRLALLLAYLAFVSLGLPDTVLGAAWPALRSELALPLDGAGGALVLTTIGVVLSSAAHGALSARVTTAFVLIGSTALAAVALLTIAFSTNWSTMLCASLLGGLGGGAVDAALNAYVARMHSARHMTWLHGFWGVGATLAPLAIASALRLGASWRTAYGAIGAIELCLAVTFLLTRQLWVAEPSHAAQPRAGRAPAPTGARWSARASVLLFYGYGGLEAGAGLWSASWLVSTRAMSPAAASATVSLYWGALTIGRFLIGVRADALGPVRVLRAAALLALAACGVLALPDTPTWLSAAALFVLGLALAPVYPLTMHDTIARFGGQLGDKLIGQHVAATTLGVATLPWLIGALAERVSLHLVPLLLALLALWIVVFGHERRRWPS